ncbi:MAG: M20/M25/M40 family metallo-hydrolase [Anaerolineae bacterium]|jgi:uncharacterized protein|nr:M20/M25/M40 family metallo-hydrolase [Anaerolineae bacterium]MBT7072659.1 M20/M25/M40 family metallo-hydrolase [Anaerolineae bacterium]MBT7324910.1 M20/M25/M40 family metallo-hydrolase [Anaerolineae bacterium]
MNQTAKALPVQSKERIQIVDVLRGFAILGILLFNMRSFAGQSMRIDDWVEPLDRAIVAFIDFFVQAKFYSLFSFLFGWGMAVQMRRAEVKGTKFFPVYLRRLLILLVFGTLHGVLLWTGDILRMYAVIGIFMLLIFRKLSPKILLVAAALLLLSAIQMTLPGELMDNTREWCFSLSECLSPNATLPGSLYRTGTYWQVTQLRYQEFIGSLWWLPCYMGNIFAMMLLGLYAGKRKLFANFEEHHSLFRKAMWSGLIIGLVFNSLFTYFTIHPIQHEYATLVRIGSRTIGAPALTIFYISGITLLFQKEKWRERLAPLSYVGRMALTNYISHSVILTFFFYGYGLGLYGETDPTFALLLTVIVYLAQIRFSQWWLEHYQFGPLEWGWRALTYARRHPFSAKDTYESIQRTPAEIHKGRMRILGVIWVFLIIWAFGLFRWSTKLSVKQEISPLEQALRGMPIPDIELSEEIAEADEYVIISPVTEPITITPGPAAAIGDLTALAAAFDVENALTHVEELTQSKYDGRAAGSEGGQLAAEYIATQFERYGLQPAGVDSTFYQDFPVSYTTLDEIPRLTITSSDGTIQDSYIFHQDFSALIGAYLGAGSGSGDVVWVNDCSHAAFAGLNVVNKIVFCENGDTTEIGRNATENGAVGLLLLTDPNEIPPQSGTAFLPIWIPQPIPAFLVYSDVAEDLLAGSGITLADLTLIFEPFELQTKAVLQVSASSPCSTDGCFGHNVLGVLPGSDPNFAEQVIIVGASYDSLGSSPDELVWHGANESLSGVAALLEIARSWREQAYVPRVATLFVAWGAEEQGSLGAAYYATYPQYPPENILDMIQLDTVEANTYANLPDDTLENIDRETLRMAGETTSLTLLGLAEGPAEIEDLLTRRAQAVVDGDIAVFLATSALTERDNDILWFYDAQALSPLSTEMAFSELQMVGDTATALVKITLEAAGENGGSREIALSMPAQFRYSEETWLWAGADLMLITPPEDDDVPRFSVAYPDGKTAGLNNLGEIAAAQYAEIATLLGMPAQNNARILLFDGNEALRASTAMSMGRSENAAVSPNTIKLAYSAEIADGERFNDAIAHLVLADAGIPQSAAPWLWEGLPLLIAAENDPISTQATLIPPLLNSVNKEGAPLHAETSWAAVEYLRSRSGWAGLGNFIAAFGRACQSNHCTTEEGADAALTSALHMDTEAFHRTWQQHWSTRLEKAQTSLNTLIATRNDTVLKGDLNAFLATVDRRTPNLLREETDWFADLSEYPLESFSLSAKPVAILEDGSIHASVTMSYQLEGVSARWGDGSSTFRILFKPSGNSYRWAGVPLENISGNRVRVRYPSGQEEFAAELLTNAEEIYAQIAADTNTSRPAWQTINLYSDANAYRTSIFLSYPNNDWSPGWSAQGHSLKLLIDSDAATESYRPVLAAHLARQLLLQNGVQDEWLLTGGSSYLARGVDGGTSQMAAAANLYSLGKAIETESLFDFAAFPAPYRLSEAEYKIAIPQAWNSIRYLAETYGQDALWRVLRSGDISPTERTLPEFATDWQASFAIGHSTANWVFIAKAFDEERALTHIDYLTSPELAGRQAGSPGSDLAATYITEKFAEYGLEVAEQIFPVTYQYYLETPQMNIVLQSGEAQEAFVYRKDFLMLQAVDTVGALSGELVWIMDADYTSMDLDDNIAVRKPTGTIDEEIAQATAHGASALLLVGDRSNIRDLNAKYLVRTLPSEGAIPVLELTREGFRRLLEMSSESIASLYSAPPALFLGMDMSLKIALNEDTAAEAANIFGFLPSSDPILGSEIILVGAHYDHVGDDPEQRYSGANDNASGVATMLEIARLWQETGYRPERSVLFVAWGAQELGELGSRYYVENPLYPLDEVVALLQLDAVAGGGAFHLDAQGSRENDGQLLYSIEHAKDLFGGRLQLSFPEGRGEAPFSPDILFDRDRIGIRSDHDPFREMGIQALRIAWREADETNLDDTLADEIDPARLAAAGKMTILTIMMNTR